MLVLAQEPTETIPAFDGTAPALARRPTIRRRQDQPATKPLTATLTIDEFSAIALEKDAPTRRRTADGRARDRVPRKWADYITATDAAATLDSAVSSVYVFAQCPHGCASRVDQRRSCS